MSGTDNVPHRSPGPPGPPGSQLQLNSDDFDWLGVLDGLTSHGPDGRDRSYSIEHAQQHQQPGGGGGPHDGAPHHHQLPALPESEAGRAQHLAVTSLVGGLVPAQPPPAGGADDEATNAALAAAESIVVEAAMSGGGLGAPVVVAGAAGREESNLSAASRQSSGSGSGSGRTGSQKEGGGSSTGVSSEDRKLARVERKRCREKQRRLDTNSQFAALVDVVREVELQDLAEEARIQRRGGLGIAFGRHAGQPRQDASAAPGTDGGKDGDADGPPGKAPPPSGAPSVPGGEDDDGTAPSLPASAGDSKSCPILAFNPSNRVDLIARTIQQVQRLRELRRSKNDELRAVYGKNSEMRKEIERLRRTVAHHKAMELQGRSHMPQQQRMMMMVPMMVDPSQNFGASTNAGGAMMMMPQMAMSPGGATMGMMPQQQQQMMMPVNPMAGINPMAVVQGGQQQRQHAGANPPDGGNPMAAAARPQQQVMNMGTSNPLDMAQMQQQVPQYGGSQLQGGVAGNGDSGADTTMGDAQQQGGAVLPPADQQQQQPFAVPQQQQQQQQQYHQPAPPTFAMYPQMSGGVPTVQLGLHPHHGGVQPQVGGAPPPAAPGNSGATAPGGEGKRSSPQPAISDGGHLAHCA